MSDSDAAERRKAAREAQRDAADQAEAKAEEKEQELPTYTLERFLSDESVPLVGQPASVVAGALTLSGNRKKELTAEEVKAACAEYLKAEQELPVFDTPQGV